MCEWCGYISHDLDDFFPISEQFHPYHAEMPNDPIDEDEDGEEINTLCFICAAAGMPVMWVKNRFTQDWEEPWSREARDASETLAQMLHGVYSRLRRERDATLTTDDRADD